MELKKVLINSGKFVNGFQLEFNNGFNSTYTPWVGGRGGSQETWDVPTGEYITQIEIRSGWYIDAITFITNTGNKSPMFGEGGGGYHLYTLPPG